MGQNILGLSMGRVDHMTTQHREVTGSHLGNRVPFRWPINTLWLTFDQTSPSHSIAPL